MFNDDEDLPWKSVRMLNGSIVMRWRKLGFDRLATDKSFGIKLFCLVLTVSVWANISENIVEKVFLEELLKYVAYKSGSSAVSAEKRKQHKNDLSLPFEKIIELFWSFIFLKWVAWNEILDLVEMVYLLPAQDTKCNLCKIEEVLCFLLLDFQIASFCILYSAHCTLVQCTAKLILQFEFLIYSKCISRMHSPLHPRFTPKRKLVLRGPD